MKGHLVIGMPISRATINQMKTCSTPWKARLTNIKVESFLRAAANEDGFS